MTLAWGKLPDDNPVTERLRADIAMFVRQKGNHTALHEAFNAMLVRNGYTDLPTFEVEMKADYQRFLKTKSLKFLCANCEGFETLGPIAAYAWLDHMDHFLEGEDQNVVNRFKWHLMDEFEHRSVCFEVYDTLFGGYFYRVYGLI
jgi:predicted metal-dependent hydrolase